jgi:hypothetical protein
MTATRLNKLLAGAAGRAVPFCGLVRRRPDESRSIPRPVISASALGVALTLALTGAASAQTPFQATVSSTQTLPAGPCSNGAYICGTADLAGYGAASWNMYVTNAIAVPTACGSSYTATTQFTLASDPSSTLVLDEAGSLCGLGHDGAAYRGYFNEPSQAYGHPFAIVGSWSVDAASTGRFFGLAGSGTDLVKIAGAQFAGSYPGTIG